MVDRKEDTISSLKEKASTLAGSVAEKIGVDSHYASTRAQQTVQGTAGLVGIQNPAVHGNEGQVGKPEKNRAVVYQGTEKVSVENIGYPKMQDPDGRALNNGVILKVLISGICGSDLHAYSGRTTAVPGKLIFGHEITGEIIEKGVAVNKFNIGDWVSVPFNITCGTCENCKMQNYHGCLTTNNEAPGMMCGIYGYPLSGGWQGGQADYVFVPHADFQLLKLPDEIKQRPEKLIDLATLADIWPTAHHGCVEAGVSVGKSVYIAGAGPVGLLALQSALLLGASRVFVGDVRPERLVGVQKLGGIPIDLSKMHTDDAKKFIAQHQYGRDSVDCAVECVGYEASGHGRNHSENHPMEGVDTCIQLIRSAGHVGVIGVFLPADTGGPDKDFKMGKQKMRFGEAWVKGLSLHGGQAPVQRYNHALLQMILHDKVSLAPVLNAQVIPIEDAPEGYRRFKAGQHVKFWVDPFNSTGRQHKIK